jgi:hypothetical protein
LRHGRLRDRRVDNAADAAAAALAGPCQKPLGIRPARDGVY